MPLNDVKIRNAKPKPKPYKLPDGDGMFLQVMPSGSKYWRLRYRFMNKEKLLALGVYPEGGLADARERRFNAHKDIAAGNDPSQVKQEARRQAILKSASTFEAVARDWHKRRGNAWTERHAVSLMRRLEVDIFPRLGTRPVAEITPPELLSVIRIMEKRDALDLAQRMMQTCGQIFMYAIATGHAVRKPMNFMSENTMLYALYRMGYHSRTTGHGLRATASTILNENGFTPDVIERQLAHVERNKIRAAYNHAQYLPERRKMMQWWADYLERVAKTGKE
ncbi:MAG: integrase arm-type DNA-binding domain-containing protein [Alphaproteobacteria bacterium]